MMNTEIRAKRILAKLRQFKFMESTDEKDFGKSIGFYENTQGEKDRISFYEHGICWNKANGLIKIPFNQIKNVQIDEKTDDYLQIILLNGSLLRLPVKGKNGRFTDICEMLRFFDRVIDDLKKKGNSYEQH